MQVVLQAEFLLQFHMARDSSDSSLQYPTRYLAEDNTTLDVDIRLNRYITQTQASLNLVSFTRRYAAKNRCYFFPSFMRCMLLSEIK